MEKTNSYTFKGFKATNEDFRQCLSECIKEIKSIDTKLDLILSQQEKGHSNGRKISRKPKYYYQ